MSMSKENSVLSIINGVVMDLPSPSNISYFWNFGSLLGLCLVIQILTGIFLAMHYCSDANLAFSSVMHITSDVNYGYLLSYLHANGASAFFICVYIHMASGLYYGSYLSIPLWNSGVLIFGMMMLTAFMGYVLPWGQMSFWGATVITNFVSAVPYMGNDMVQWIWGGFSVSGATLNSFYSFHYLFPFALAGMMMVHIMLLHDTGSNNPMGLKSEIDKVTFHVYYTMKDAHGFMMLGILISLLMFYTPNLLGDAENFIPANPLVTPVHMMPEWYFLFAYAILSAIPNKLGGVMALVASMVVLLMMPFIHTSKLSGLTFSPLGKMAYWLFMANFVLLTWMGSKPVEDPFMFMGQLSSMFYFSYFLMLMPTLGEMENKIMFSLWPTKSVLT